MSALFLLIQASKPAYAVNTEDVLRKCDRAVQSCKKAIDLKVKIIRDQDELLQDKDKELANLKSSQNSVFKSPFFWLVIGAVVGGVTTALIKR